MQDQLGRLMVTSAIGVWDAPVSARQIEREATALLEQVPLFAGLSRRQIGRVASVAAHKHCLAGAELVRLGAPADAFYVILDGDARVDIPSGAVPLGPGDYFGEMALIDGEPRTATVTAVTDIVVLTIPRQKFLALLVAEPKVTLAIMTTLVQRVRAAEAGPDSNPGRAWRRGPAGLTGHPAAAKNATVRAGSSALHGVMQLVPDLARGRCEIPAACRHHGLDDRVQLLVDESLTLLPRLPDVEDAKTPASWSKPAVWISSPSGAVSRLSAATTAS